MGTRVIYQVQDNSRNLIATLLSNSSHGTRFVEEVFAQATQKRECRVGPSALIKALLTARYETAEGNHHKGDRIFWHVPADEVDGNREYIIVATHVGLRGTVSKSGNMAR